MEFQYCLSYTSSDYLPSFYGEIRVALRQAKQGALEIGVSQNAPLLITIRVYSQPM